MIDKSRISFYWVTHSFFLSFAHPLWEESSPELTTVSHTQAAWYIYALNLKGLLPVVLHIILYNTWQRDLQTYTVARIYKKGTQKIWQVPILVMSAWIYLSFCQLAIWEIIVQSKYCWLWSQFQTGLTKVMNFISCKSYPLSIHVSTTLAQLQSTTSMNDSLAPAY